MNLQKSLRRAALLAAALVLVACGGGESSRDAVQGFADRATPLAPSSNLLRTSAPPVNPAPPPSRAITNQELFTWVQNKFPSIFGSAPPQSGTVSFGGKTYDVRYYAASGGVYLGIADGEVYGLGAITGNQLVPLGQVQTYACEAVPAICQAQPGGTINACLDPATASLPTGFRINVVYQYSGLIGGEWTIDSVIDGPATFEGQNVVQVTSTTSGTHTTSIQGITSTTSSTTVVKSYEQATVNGLVRSLGALTDVNTSTTISAPIPGFPGTTTTTSTQTKTVINPPVENIEFTISIGQSIDKVVSQTTTTLAMTPMLPTGLPAPVSSTTTTRHTFEARENVTVGGKTYDACRYRIGTVNGTDITTSWLIAGKGVMVKSQATTAAGTQTIELKSGTYNGAPL